MRSSSGSVSIEDSFFASAGARIGINLRRSQYHTWFVIGRAGSVLKHGMGAAQDDAYPCHGVKLSECSTEIGGSSLDMGNRKPPQHEHASFPTREDGIARIEVHVAGVCVRQIAGKWHVLAAKRSPIRSLFPNHWECGGGMVHAGESFAS